MAIDDNKVYGLTGAQLKELPGKIEAVKGLARDLTEADYNWPTSNPERVAIWKLPSGIYTHSQANIAITNVGNVGYNQYLIIVDSTNQTDTDILLFNHNEMLLVDKVRKSDGYSYGRRSFLESTDVVNNLTSTSTTSPLSANQGKVLNDKITPTSGSGAPTTSTVGILGKIYIDTDTDTAYMCVKADTTTPEYTWKQITA